MQVFRPFLFGHPALFSPESGRTVPRGATGGLWIEGGINLLPPPFYWPLLLPTGALTYGFGKRAQMVLFCVRYKHLHLEPGKMFFS